MHWYSVFSSSRTGPFQHRPCPQGAGEATTGIDTTRRMQITHSVLEFRRTSLGSGVRAGKGFPLWKDPVFGAFAFWFFGPVQCQGCITTQEARPKPGTSSGVQLGMSSPAIPGFFGIDRLGNGKEFPTRSGWQGPRTALPMQAKLGEWCQRCSSGRARGQPHTSTRRIPNLANAPAAASRQDHPPPGQSTASAGRGSLPTTQSRFSLPEPPQIVPPQQLHVGPHALGAGLCMPWQTQGKSILFGVILVVFTQKKQNPSVFPNFCRRRKGGLEGGWLVFF